MAISSIHHLGLSVKSLQKTTQFFTDVLNFEVVRELPDYPAKFVSNGPVFITLWQTDESATDFDRKKNAGLHHFALKVEHENELLDIFAKAEKFPEVKVEFAPEPLGDGPAQHCMLFEPGGIRIEFIWTP